MYGLTTHILDTSLGTPASGIIVIAEKQIVGSSEQWEQIGKGESNDDGRVQQLLGSGFKLEPGIYRLTFETKSYFARSKRQSFYPKVQIAFEISSLDRHYHVPLLISGFGYSTYRGS